MEKDHPEIRQLMDVVETAHQKTLDLLDTVEDPVAMAAWWDAFERGVRIREQALKAQRKART